MQHFRQRRVHALALPGGEDRDVERGGQGNRWKKIMMIRHHESSTDRRTCSERPRMIHFALADFRARMEPAPGHQEPQRRRTRMQPNRFLNAIAVLFAAATFSAPGWAADACSNRGELDQMY